MSFAERFNRSNSKFSLSTSGFSYKKLSECYSEFGVDKVYEIGAVFINTKNTYGDNPVVAVVDGFYVNLPSHLLNDCREMMNDEAVVNDINSGLCGFSIYQYNSHGRVCYGVKWVDLSPVNEKTDDVVPF